MSDPAVAAVAPVRPASPVRSRYDRTAWWVKVLVIFAVSRVITTTILLIFASLQQQNAWTSANPDYFSFASLWDAHWYYIISVTGYPSELPLTADGHVAENAWAFMPVYPLLVGALSTLTTVPFSVMAVCVSTGFALGTALVFYRLLILVVPAGQALFAVVLFCVAPLSPILQVAYAEPMGLFLLTVALYLLMQRRYWSLLPVIAVMSLTRPTGLAFALAMGLHVIYRWVKRDTDPFSRADRVASTLAGGFSAVMGFAWLLIAWAVTGSFSAYTDTELAWRAAYIGYGELVPFSGWIAGANWWLARTNWGIPEGVGPIVLLITVAGFVAVMFSAPVKRLGVDLRLWLASYALYILAVFFPQSSTFRLLIPMFPLLGALAQPRSALYRIFLVALCITGQIGWIYIGWWVDGYDWTPP